MISLRVVHENEFFDTLNSRGFKPTGIKEGDLDVWMYNGHAYTLPMPVYSGNPAKNEKAVYCPFAVSLFFERVTGAEAEIETNEHEHKDYNVVEIKGGKKS